MVDKNWRVSDLKRKSTLFNFFFQELFSGVFLLSKVYRANILGKGGGGGHMLQEVAGGKINRLDESKTVHHHLLFLNLLRGILIYLRNRHM